MASFAEADLGEQLVRALASNGMTEPFPIQAAALPDAIAGENLLGRAQTGAGKTLAFGLPLLHRLHSSRVPRSPNRPRGLVLVPTRELCQQVADALVPFARALGLRVTTVYGGTSMGRQIESLRRGADVVVATPGRLTDLIQRRACSLDDVSITVLDEADHMCDLGFLPVVLQLLEQVPQEGQRLLFSATLDGDVSKLVRRHLPNPVLVTLEDDAGSADKMAHHAFEVADRTAKQAMLRALAGGAGRTLLFSRTKHGADRLAHHLNQAGIRAAALHGGMTQGARSRALRGFSEGQCNVLVATDVAARGIHVDQVDLVVHADPPTEVKTYLHRSGRTARAGASGAVVTVSVPEERNSVERLLRAAGVQVRPRRSDPTDTAVVELVGPPRI